MSAAITPGLHTPAHIERMSQIHHIDHQIDHLTDLAAAVRAKAEQMDPRSWAYTGRGSDLDEIETHLAAALRTLIAITR